MGGTVFQPMVRSDSRLPLYNWRLAIARFGLEHFHRLRDDSSGNLAGGNLAGKSPNKGYDYESTQEDSRGDTKVGGCKD